MSSSSDDDTESLLLSLDGLQQSLSNMIENHAVMIWWHVKHCVFTYLCEQDVNTYEEEVDMMRRGWENGTILTVHAGPTLRIGGSNLYPILMEFENVECPVYYLLSQTGDTDLLRYIPYFFTTENGRHEFIAIFTPETRRRNVLRTQY